MDSTRNAPEGLTEGQRDGFDCVDCGAVAPPVMRPVAVVAGVGQVFTCCRPHGDA
jgi:hypothetical protein